MRLRTKLLIAFVSLFFTVGVNAEGLKIATVNVQAIIAKDQAGFNNSAQMRNFLHARNDYMVKEQSFVTNLPVMGKDKQKSMRDDLAKMKTTLVKQQEALRVLVQTRQQKLYAQISQFSQQIAQKQKYGLVLNKAAVIYEKGATVDITPQVESLILSGQSVSDAALLTPADS
jgi:Skp family chaperone for outer membrane proteins